MEVVLKKIHGDGDGGVGEEQWTEGDADGSL